MSPSLMLYPTLRETFSTKHDRHDAGERHREEVCVRLDSGTEVPPEYCGNLQRLAPQTERCNPCTVQ